MRIEICGPIGVGKSSLAKLLIDQGFSVVFEEFKLNPFWKAFYTNPDKYNFETELTFLLQHYHEVKRKKEEVASVACDFSFIQDLAYAEMGLKPTALNIFKEAYNYILEELGNPTLIIYLHCPTDILLERIRIRGRDEEQLINAEFLKTLDNHINKVLNNKLTQTKQIRNLTLNTNEINFISSVQQKEYVFNEIKNKLM